VWTGVAYVAPGLAVLFVLALVLVISERANQLSDTEVALVFPEPRSCCPPTIYRAFPTAHVVIRSATADVELWYTTDGTDPVPPEWVGGARQLRTGSSARRYDANDLRSQPSIDLASSQPLEVRAVAACPNFSLAPSRVSTRLFTEYDQILPPVITLGAAGTHGRWVELASQSAGTTLCFTAAYAGPSGGGSEPMVYSPEKCCPLLGPFTGACTVTAWALRAGHPSEHAVATLELPTQAEPPTLSRERPGSVLVFA
jgi:hypothetical protein